MKKHSPHKSSIGTCSDDFRPNQIDRKPMLANKMLLTSLCLLCLLLGPRSAFAQASSIYGTVRDSTDQSALTGAYVILTSMADSLKAVNVTDNEGQFHFGSIKAGRYSLKVTFLGYKSFEKDIEYQGRPIDVGNIIIAPQNKLLNEVQINGQVIPTEQKGDTTEYNSQAYKTTPDASAEDLVRKMPGIVVENGKVQAQGEDVQEVTVDGKKFFGNDPTLALRNLPAEVIDKIQVFDKLSDQAQFTGFDDGQTTKTINIVTRRDRRNGQFGKIFAGAGTENTYQVGGNVNIFNGDQRISIIGQSNNINQQNFSTQDLLGVVGSSGGRGGMGRMGRGGGGSRGGGGNFRGGFGGGGSVENFLIGQQNGISTTHAIGLNFNDNWGKKIEVNGSYFFNASKNVSDQRSNQEYFLPDAANQFYNEAYSSNSHNYNNRLNMRLDYKIDSANSILFIPSLNFQTNRSITDLLGQTSQSEQLLSQSSNITNNNVNGYNLSNRILFRHRFGKDGRTISIGLNTGNNKNDGNKSLNAQNNYYNDQSVTADSVDQLTRNNTDGYSVSSNVVYTEPISKSGQIMATYNVSYSKGKSDKNTFNFNESGNSYSLLDTALSNHFDSKYITQHIGAGYRFRGEKYFAMLSMNYQIAELQNQQYFPDQAKLNYTYGNFLPFGMFNYRFDRQKNLRIFYRTSTQQPSVNQLQNVLDNSNPLQLNVGNPELDQQYQHMMIFRYSSSDFSRSNTFFAMFSGGLTEDYITNATYITTKDTLVGSYEAPAGVQLTKPVNLNGYWSFRSFVAYGIPVKPLKSNLNLNASFNFARIPGLINGIMNYSNSTNYGINLVLSSNISENLDFTISSSSNYNTAINTIQNELNNKYFNQASRFTLEWIFWKGLVYKTDLNHQYYTGLSQGYDQNYLIWNMSIGKKLFKNQRGEILLSVFDLLNQNTNVQRNVTDAYIEDVQTNVLQRFAMLTFTYNLRNFGMNKSGAEPPDMMHRRDHFGPGGPGPGMGPYNE